MRNTLKAFQAFVIFGVATALSSVQALAQDESADAEPQIVNPQVTDAVTQSDARLINGKSLASVKPRLDGYVAAHMVDHFPPGLFVAIATKDEALILPYGVANFETGEAATDETLFRIASISKTFVWTSVMMLVDEGLIDLDTDVNVYLKNIKIPDAFGAPVTMNDLMAHRAGFEDTLGDFFSGHAGLTTEEMLIRQMPKRVAPPGLRVSYSNWGTTLASQIIADVSGVPFDAFVRQRIFAPLGLDETTLRDPALSASAARNPADLDARTARPHVMEEGAPTPVDYASVE
ncbi:MAG: serine hydrolase domain-containing protein, partial [Pseudomonadota bacterium]